MTSTAASIPAWNSSRPAPLFPAQLPTAIHRLENFVAHAGDIDLWIKRDDLTGLVGGGNKTRKLEFLIAMPGPRLRHAGDRGCDQSNHTRQTAAAAAKAGMKAPCSTTGGAGRRTGLSQCRTSCSAT